MAPRDKFKFIFEKEIRRDLLDLTVPQSIHLREILPKGTYWVQLFKRGLIAWNYTLLSSYLRNGMDSPEHQALLAEYEASLDKPEPPTTPYRTHD